MEMTGIPAATARCIRIWNGNHNTLRLLIDRRIDKLGHLHHVKGFRCTIIDLCARILCRFGDAVLDDRPERIRCLTVTDDNDINIGRAGCERRSQQRHPGHCRFQ